MQLQPLPECTWEKLEGEKKKKPRLMDVNWQLSRVCLMVADALLRPCSEEPPAAHIFARTDRELVVPNTSRV